MKELYDAVIVGSGASAAAAAWELQDKKLLILDVGLPVPGWPHPGKNIFELRRLDENQGDYLIGKDFESLVNIGSKDLVSVKLKAPLTAFVIEDKNIPSPIRTRNFAPFISYAYGGLANAWGAGVYRFCDYDLKGFPFGSGRLTPFYDELTRLIGISGENDDLQPFFGTVNHLQESLELNLNGRHLYGSYWKRKKTFQEKGVFIGRTQLTVLTEEMEGRPPYEYDNTSFFTCRNPSIFTPPLLMDRLKDKSNIAYRAGYLVESFGDKKNFVEVSAKELETGRDRIFRGKKLLMAAGAVNSGRILLQSYRDCHTQLPILDNPVSFVPFVDLRAIGAKTDRYGYEGGQLILIYEGKHHPQRVQGSFYSYISPLRADIFFQFPLSLRGNLALVKYITPAMGILQLFYPDRPRRNNFIRLEGDGTLEINYTDVPPLGRVERHIARLFLKAGFVSVPGLFQFPQPGNSIHYAGTVPMGREDLAYNLDENCRLNRAPNVYFVDGSGFPLLPAKNLTFTLMANAMRVARKIKSNL